jgi:hypothetical protein
MSAKKGFKSNRDKCPDCNTLVKKNDDGMCCESCGDWHHIGCIQMEKGVYDNIIGIDNLHWFCEGCNAKVSGFLSEIVGLQKRQEAMETKFEQMKEFFDKLMTGNKEKLEAMEEKVSRTADSLKHDQTEMSTKLDKLNKTFEDQNHELQCVKKAQDDLRAELQIKELTKAFIKDTEWADVVKKEVDTSLNKVSEEINGIQRMVCETKIQAEEEKDKEERARNIIIYRVEESKSGAYEERSKDDKVMACNIIKALIDEEFDEKEISKVFRLGKNSSEKERPLLIQFESRMTKNLLLQNLFKLKRTSFKNIVISQDMTLNERTECKKLHEEAKGMETADQSGGNGCIGSGVYQDK